MGALEELTTTPLADVAADAQRAAAAHILTCRLKYQDGGPFDGGFNLGLQRAADELIGIAQELDPTNGPDTHPQS